MDEQSRWDAWYDVFLDVFVSIWPLWLFVGVFAVGGVAALFGH